MGSAAERRAGAVPSPPDTRRLVVVPPIRYHGDGRVPVSAFDPAREIQRAIEAVPDPIGASVRAVGGPTGLPRATESYLSERQQAALEAGLEPGYCDVPREAAQEDVAAALGCSPGTAAEHIAKREPNITGSVIERQ